MLALARYLIVTACVNFNMVSLFARKAYICCAHGFHSMYAKRIVLIQPAVTIYAPQFLCKFLHA